MYAPVLARSGCGRRGAGLGNDALQPQHQEGLSSGMQYPPWVHTTPAPGYSPLSHTSQPHSEDSPAQAWVRMLGIGAWIVSRPADAGRPFHHHNLREVIMVQEGA